MKFWIDGDACPRAVKDIVYRAAERLRIETLLVANNDVGVPRSTVIKSLRVDAGPDVADDYIADNAEPGDIVITNDIPLAARTVEKGVATISARGVVFDADNISERLSIRDFHTELRDQGVQTSGPKAFSDKDKQKFAQSFDRTTQRLVRDAQA